LSLTPTVASNIWVAATVSALNVVAAVVAAVVVAVRRPRQHHAGIESFAVTTQPTIAGRKYD